MKAPRFTVGRLMILVAIVAATLAFLVSMQGSYWVGHANVPLRFTILDDASGRPISRAIVRLPGSTAYEANPTSDDGKATIDIRVMFSGQSSLLRKTREGNFSPWRIRVLAPGYKTFTASLEDRTQDPRFYEENQAPPPIVIRMERETARPKRE